MVRVNELQDRPTVQRDVHIGGAREQAALELSSPRTLNIKDSTSSIVNGSLDMSGDIYKSNPLAKLRVASDTAGSCTVGVPDCAQRQQFKPDSRSSREWQNDMRNQRNKPLETDQNGDYKIQRGDTLWTLAERMARGEDGKKPDAKSVQKAIEDLVKANPELKCNPDYLKRGDTLHIPGRETKPTPDLAWPETDTPVVVPDEDVPQFEGPESKPEETQPKQVGRIPNSEETIPNVDEMLPKSVGRTNPSDTISGVTGTGDLNMIMSDPSCHSSFPNEYDGPSGLGNGANTTANGVP